MLLVFGEGETTSWLSGIGVAILVLMAIGGSVLAYFNNNIQLQKQIGVLNQQVFKINDEHFKCAQEQEQMRHDRDELKYDLAVYQRELSELKRGLGMQPCAPVPGVIIVDFKGIIAEYSPSLTGILGHRPEDMREKPFE